MKVKINKWLCPKGYAITLFGTIYVRTKDQYDKMVAPYSYYYNHELIHEKQANNKWIIFYIKYIYLYLKNILALRYNIKLHIIFIQWKQKLIKISMILTMFLLIMQVKSISSINIK